MTDRFDAIVVGGGHNGLVCASLLARDGKQVLLLEAKEQLGGGAITRAFADGFSVSACAHLLYQLQPSVRKELKLKPKLAAENMSTVALGEDGEHVRVSGRAVTGAGARDAEQYQAFYRRMTRFANLLRSVLNKTPPRLGSRDFRSLMTLAQLGFDIRRMGKHEMREFLRVIGMNIYDEVVERFDSPLLRGAISLDAVLGTHLGPRSPNTILTYLYRLAGDQGRISQPAGGMSAVTAEIAAAARDAGVTIRTGLPVKRILVENGRVTGVETATGERIDSLTVISNADPKRTMFELIGARHMEAGFAHRFHHLRSRGNAAKLHLALDGLPTIAGLRENEFGERLLIAPSEDYVERAFNPAKYGECSPEPVLELTFPSYRDASLAPAGKHVMSAVLQYAPYGLKGGWDDEARQEFEAAAIRVIERYAPDIASRIIASELLTPADIENEFYITGGHWHHAELTLDQFLFVRPVAGAAQYSMPIDGLYLCGAGAHPGGGISGAAGRNAARQILARERAS
jgi:phytoene dehydrogenase-like protein